MAGTDDNRDYSNRPETSIEPDRSTRGKTELADERTELANHRTLLANERTFSAWIRTGIALIGGGLTVAELLDGANDVLPKIIGIILIIMGAAVCVMALWRYNSVSRILGKKGVRVTPKLVTFILVGGLLLVTLLVLVFILIE
ncbi:DUF202 domain-containing protein [Methanosarcina hadiensis]|uniref:YidH family protein n=1 Tax=Methanosarcina hadiensis TaxID=3078083 RepID=UPI0039775459